MKTRARNWTHPLLACAALTAAVPVASAATPPAPLQGIAYAVGLNPEWEWVVRTTPHFVIHYREQSTGKIIDRVAQYFEDAHALLTGPLHWTPKKPVNVLLIDNTDSANGAAAATLDFGVIIYATPPENHSSISHYDDWLKLVIYHEYAHILNMDATNGFWRILRALTGPVTLPNSLWPRWMIEGLAVVVETRYSSLGRGRSPYWEAILRSAVADQKLRDREFISLDRVTGPNPEFPDGETPYLFGYHLMNELVLSHQERTENSGLDPLHSLGALSENSSRRLPYLLDWHLEAGGHQSWNQVWNSFLARTEVTANAQLEKIRSREVTPLTHLTPEVPDARGTVLSRDGRYIAYSADPDDRRGSVYVRDRKTGETFRIRDRILGATSTFLGQKHSGEFTHLLYSAGEVHQNFETYNDFFISPIRGDHPPQRLSEGLRVRDPDVSPSEDYIVFVKIEDLRAKLYGAPLIQKETDTEWALGKLELLYDPGVSGVVSQPRLSSDGKTVVFSVHRSGNGSEELFEEEIEKLRSAASSSQKQPTLSPLVSDGSFNRYGSYLTDGSILYTSNRSGVENLYQILPDRSQSHLRLSNVVTGLSFPQKTPEGTFVATEVRWKGTTVVELPPLSDAEQKLPAPDIRELFHPIPKGPPAPTLHIESDSPHAADTPYSPFASLTPRAWYPTLLLGTNGNFQAGAGILGYDAVDRHRYWIDGSVGRYLGQTVFDTRIDYDHLFLNSVLGVSFSSTSNGAVLEEDETLEAIRKDRTLGLTYSRPFVWTYSSFTPQVSAGFAYTLLADERDQYESWSSPRWEAPYFLIEGDYFTGESTRWSISNERGLSLSAALLGIPDGSNSALKWAASGTSYFSLGQHRVLTASARVAYAAVSATDIDRVSTLGFDGNRSSTRTMSLHQSASSILSQFITRGYPQSYFLSDLAFAADLEVRFPLVRLFRGLGVLPAYAQNLSGFAFLENTSLYQKQPSLLSHLGDGIQLPSAGAGVKVTGTLFYNIPVNAAVEIQYGFNREMGGGRTLVGALNTSLPF